MSRVNPISQYAVQWKTPIKSQPQINNAKNGIACASCEIKTNRPIWRGATPFCSDYCKKLFSKHPKTVRYPK